MGRKPFSVRYMQYLGRFGAIRYYAAHEGGLSVYSTGWSAKVPGRWSKSDYDSEATMRLECNHPPHSRVVDLGVLPDEIPEFVCNASRS